MVKSSFLKRLEKIETQLNNYQFKTQQSQPQFNSLEEFAHSCKIRSGSKMVNFKPYPYQRLLFDLIENHQSVDVLWGRQVAPKSIRKGHPMK